MQNKIDTQKKYYICQYGVFYEGQRLAEYCQTGGHMYYLEDIIIDKFIIHYYKYVPHLYFRFNIVGTKKFYTLPVERLGVFYKIK